MPRIIGVFDGVTVEMMKRAFDDTCAKLPLASEAEHLLVARRIVGTAALGERDPARMRDDALIFMFE